nr:hypothetical protein CFP56_63971 [Quercus suber]
MAQIKAGGNRSRANRADRYRDCLGNECCISRHEIFDAVSLTMRLCRLEDASWRLLYATSSSLAAMGASTLKHSSFSCRRA